MTDLRITNPWAGLSSYQDPDLCDRPLLFCGRDNESFELAHLIDDNIFVTLYGRSGTGKTSLLNAGVFPILRKEGYLPIRVRLGEDAKGMSFQQCLTNRIDSALEGVGYTQIWPVVAMPDDFQAIEYLWCFFARSRFIDQEGNTLSLILVLDQFEEVLRDRPDDTEILLRQLYYMMDKWHVLEDRIIGGQHYTYEFNFRFVIGIREDELYRLEDCIDTNYLPEMKNCRFRLRNLTETGAREVILKPGAGLFQPGEEQEIATRIIESVQLDHAKDKRVSTVALSLLCSRIVIYFQKQENQPFINLEMVSRFIGDDPFESYYREATIGLSSREKAYLENHLVDLDERRKAVSEQDFRNQVRKADDLLEGELRLLQRATSIGDCSRVELIHDSFCRPLLEMKKKREKWEIRKKWMGRLAMLLLVGFALFSQQRSLYNKQVEMNNSKMFKKISTNDSLQFEGKTPLSNVNSGSLTADGITYSTSNPSEKHISEWAAEYRHLCSSKIEPVIKSKEFNIPSEMVKNHPCLVYLILNSSSISESDEKQNWFDLYHLMNEGQINQLYSILYREAYKLASIEAKYQERQESITQRYKLYDHYSSLKQEDSSRNRTKCKEILNEILDTYEGENPSDDFYGTILNEALSLYEEDYREDPSCRSELVNLKNRQGVYFLRTDQYEDAMAQFESAYQLDPSLSAAYLAKGCNALAYEYARAGDHDRALETIDRAINLQPREANYYDSKGEILLLQGDQRGAKRMWKKVLRMDPDFLSNYDSELYKQLKNKKLVN